MVALKVAVLPAGLKLSSPARLFSLPSRGGKNSFSEISNILIDN
jgi:hypothetical protein